MEQDILDICQDEHARLLLHVNTNNIATKIQQWKRLSPKTLAVLSPIIAQLSQRINHQLRRRVRRIAHDCGLPLCLFQLPMFVLQRQLTLLLCEIVVRVSKEWRTDHVQLPQVVCNYLCDQLPVVDEPRLARVVPSWSLVLSSRCKPSSPFEAGRFLFWRRLS